MLGFFFMYPGRDLNPHTVTGTTPSKWRVYQFHHPGSCKNAANVKYFVYMNKKSNENDDFSIKKF